jgi:CheY-like chemotaxis protein
VLQELGYQTDGATDARKALELFRKERFDLVVTDYKMPDMNGVELIAKLRDERPEIPVILISGFVDALGLTEKNTGANAVIMKSANEVQHLIRTANRLLKIQRKPPQPVRSTASRTRKKA